MIFQREELVDALAQILARLFERVERRVFDVHDAHVAGGQGEGAHLALQFLDAVLGRELDAVADRGLDVFADQLVGRVVQAALRLPLPEDPDRGFHVVERRLAAAVEVLQRPKDDARREHDVHGRVVGHQRADRVVVVEQEVVGGALSRRPDHGEGLVQRGQRDDRVFDRRVVPGRLREVDRPQVRLRIDRDEVRGLLQEELERLVFFFGAEACAQREFSRTKVGVEVGLELLLVGHGWVGRHDRCR